MPHYEVQSCKNTSKINIKQDLTMPCQRTAGLLYA